MKSKVFLICIVLSAILFEKPVFAQGVFKRIINPDFVGGGFVATHRDGLQESTSSGPGFEIFAKYKFTPNFFLKVGGGYYLAWDDFLSKEDESYTIFPAFDVNAGYDILGDNTFSPFIFAGINIFKAERNVISTNLKQDFGWDLGITAGGGLRYQFTSSVGAYISGDYRYMVTDYADPKIQYWTAKAGVSLALRPKPRRREVVEYPFQNGDLALDDLFRERPADQPRTKTRARTSEDDALALLFGDVDSRELQDDEDDVFAALFEERPVRRTPERETTTAATYPDTDVGRLLANIQDLRGMMTEKDQEIASLRRQIQSNEQAIASLSRDRALPYTDDAFANITLQNYSERYQEALQSHYNKKHDEAIRKFQTLLNAHPDHRLASNCQYWIGEAYNAKKDYQQAITAFNRVLDYRSSYKFDDALIMTGIIHMRLGENSAARNHFQQLITRFPDSEYAPRAMRYLGRL